MSDSTQDVVIQSPGKPVSSIPWNEEKLIRLIGCDGVTPTCVSRTFLCGNPLRWFHKVFSGQYGEPAYEMFTLPGGRVVKAYRMDVPEAVLQIFIGLLWQFPSGYIDNTLYLSAMVDYREIKISNGSFKEMLRYYGFIPLQEEEVKKDDDDEHQPIKEPPVIATGQIPLSPPLMTYRLRVKAIYDKILSKSPKWHDFETGSSTSIIFQFAAMSDWKAGDERTLVLEDPTDGNAIIAIAGILQDLMDTKLTLPSEWDSPKKFLLGILTECNPVLSTCKMTVLCGQSKTDRIIEYWPLTRKTRYDPAIEPVETLSSLDLLKNTVLDEEYFCIKMKIQWT